MQRSGGVFPEGRRDGAQRRNSATSPSATPSRPASTDQEGLGQSARQRSAAAAWIGTCGWARRPSVPFNVNRWGVRESPTFSDLPLFLGLCRRRHDRLGHPPDRSDPPVLRRTDAARPYPRMGGKFYVEDNRDTPDTMLATFRYPKFLSTATRAARAIRCRCSGQGAGTAIHGTEATHHREPQRLPADSQRKVQRRRADGGRTDPRDGRHERAALEEFHRVHQDPPEAHQRYRDLRALHVDVPAGEPLHAPHEMQLDWDEKNWTVLQDDVKPFLKLKYRAPWKLEV